MNDPALVAGFFYFRHWPLAACHIVNFLFDWRTGLTHGISTFRLWGSLACQYRQDRGPRA
jgi:hypothetical protein